MRDLPDRRQRQLSDESSLRRQAHALGCIIASIVPNIADPEDLVTPLIRQQSPVSRRTFVRTSALTAAALAAPCIVRAQRPLTLRFRTIPDPDGWHPTLRLKGDWLVVELSDGVLSGTARRRIATTTSGASRR